MWKCGTAERRSYGSAELNIEMRKCRNAESQIYGPGEKTEMRKSRKQKRGSEELYGNAERRINRAGEMQKCRIT